MSGHFPVTPYIKPKLPIPHNGNQLRQHGSD